MANQLAANPWEINDAGATVLFAHHIPIDHFELVGYTAETDTVTVTDKNGKTVWLGNGWTDLSPVSSGRIGTINGLIVSAKTSGKLLVYFE